MTMTSEPLQHNQVIRFLPVYCSGCNAVLLKSKESMQEVPAEKATISPKCDRCKRVAFLR